MVLITTGLGYVIKVPAFVQILIILFFIEVLVMDEVPMFREIHLHLR